MHILGLYQFDAYIWLAVCFNRRSVRNTVVGDAFLRGISGGEVIACLLRSLCNRREGEASYHRRGSHGYCGSCFDASIHSWSLTGAVSVLLLDDYTKYGHGPHALGLIPSAGALILSSLSRSSKPFALCHAPLVRRSLPLKTRSLWFFCGNTGDTL
jgi:hypothetical protein